VLRGVAYVAGVPTDVVPTAVAPHLGMTAYLGTTVYLATTVYPGTTAHVRPDDGTR
jgi:hypothetical protein